MADKKECRKEKNCPFFSQSTGCTASNYERSQGCESYKAQSDRHWEAVRKQLNLNY